MRQTFLTSALALVVFTLLLGFAYPLAMTGVSQVAFPGAANGSQIEVDGKPVASSLLAQDVSGARADTYFQPRPSATGYDPSATFFANQGPNQKATKAFYDEQLAAYLAREGADNPGLTRAGVPVDAVTDSASGVDPHISKDNAEIQARRVARVRGLSLQRVRQLIDHHTDGRFLGFVGEAGVNVTALNLALDQETR